MVLSTRVQLRVAPFFKLSYFASQLGGPLPPSPRARVNRETRGLEGEWARERELGNSQSGTRARGLLGERS